MAGGRVRRPVLYLDALRRAGARTAILAPGEEGDPEEILEPFDALLLVGGGDIDPARYGGSSNEHVYGVEPDRDEAEFALLHAADRLAMPTLCICRGVQVMNVAFGGTLHGHLPDLPGMQVHGVPLDQSQTIHDVKPEPGEPARRRHEGGRSRACPTTTRGSTAWATASRSRVGRRTA